ncbi:MAG TPA: NADH-quinone oxidoreductase subunit D [Anaerolineaceae bacterium]|nr:NADH-quinone oxidoreductase subunit D [Anaerolineaceae bacterium]HQH85379.1 NADH-quinone oxidoreductase subunit D [Anaerolineaceae bacterium]
MSDLDQSIPNLVERFPEAVSADTRPGYSGFIVAPGLFIQVVWALRDEFGYDYLSSITAVDYLPEDCIEIVYHLYRSIGGPALVLKIKTSRADSAVPSLVNLYPGAELQEREVWDLLGVQFTGHPDLRRILTWEGFAGHPLRKDWHEPFFEEDVKPYKSRWPEGQPRRIEDQNPYHNNLAYPLGFDPESWAPDGDESLYRTLTRGTGQNGLRTDQMIVNLGPQHPSTHGVFRIAALLDGETVVDLKPVMGYLHRNHEKIGERNTFLQNMPFTDRLDYINSMSNNFGYALTVERLMGIRPTERAEYLRVIMAELTRVLNHLFAVGFLLNDLGAFFTPMIYVIEERELILDIFEAVSGSRMMCNYFRFGGVSRDLPEGIEQKIHNLVFDRLPRKIEELDAYLTNNEIVRARCEGIGVLTAEQAVALSVSGPVLRASGVPYDIRRADPYSIYDRFDFNVCVRYHGDIYDRYLIRLDEARQSLRILEQALKDMPEGPILAGKPQHTVRVPAGEAYGRVESPKGELGFYVVSNGKPNPWRYHVRAPSFVNLTALAPMSRGGKIADVVTVLGSIDIVLGEVDR